MQAQQLSPYAATEQQGYGMAAAAADGQEQMMGVDDHHGAGSDQGHKKSMLGKVKDKAKKLKAKIKKPKSPGSAGNGNESSSDSSNEDDDGGNDQNQQLGNQFGGGEGLVAGHGLRGETFEAAGVQERFGQMKLGGQTNQMLHEELPSAPGQVSEGLTPPDESRDIPAAGYEGVAAMDYEKPSSDKTDEVAQTTPSSENVSATEKSQEKPLKSISDEGENAQNIDVSGGKKSMLEQAKERIFGSTKSVNQGSQPPSAAGDEQIKAGESKPTMTGRAADTMISLKDTLASKLGYGAKSPTSEGTAQSEAMAMETDKAISNQENVKDKENVDDHSSKSVLQKLQDSATGTTVAVASKLGYGDQQQQTPNPELGSNDTGTYDNQKSYLQKMQDKAYGAKDAVATKLGYSNSPSNTDINDANLHQGSNPEQKSYLQKMQETAVGAKDAVASKLGYTNSSTNRELPAETGTNLGLTEDAYSNDQNAPVNTSARFHPGEEDRALSQLITEKMSTSAATVKDTFMRPFGSPKSSPSMPPPAAASTVAANQAHNTVVSTNDDVNTGGNAGIVGKVTGVVSSLLGTSTSAKKKSDESACKANEDLNAVEKH